MDELPGETLIAARVVALQWVVTQLLAVRLEQSGDPKELAEKFMEAVDTEFMVLDQGAYRPPEGREDLSMELVRDQARRIVALALRAATAG
jgi:hypothetical protein